MAKVFDCEDEPNEFMEAPCRCDCGKWFDLDDGHTTESNKIVCGECGEAAEEAREREEEIQDLLNDLSDANFTINACTKRLTELNAAHRIPKSNQS